jgi:hypothetical protein
MKTCLAKYGTSGKKHETKADYEIERFEDLLKIIEKIDAG